MLLLVNTTHLLKVVTTTAADIDVQASYVDYSGGTITPGLANTAIASAATTTIVDSPPTSTTRRNVKHLSIRNKHAYLSQDVTLTHHDGSTTVEIFKCTLAAGEHLVFNDGMGFQVFTATGAIKSSVDNAPGYLVYAAKIAQSGTGAPVATVVLRNTLGAIAWSYLGIGSYLGTLAGAFPASKTPITAGFCGVGSGSVSYYRLARNDDDSISLLTYNTALNAANSLLTNSFVEIRVYL